MKKKYDVFISCKSEDYGYAEEVYNFLNSNGIHTFLASKELRKMGDSEYRNAIMQALDSAYHLIIFASNPEYVESKWVFYEWDTFVNAKLNGRKDGQIMNILKGFNTNELRLDLLKYESFTFDSYKDRLLPYVETPDSRRKKEEQKRQEELLRQQAAIEAQKRIEEERQARVREEEYKKALAEARRKEEERIRKENKEKVRIEATKEKRHKVEVERMEGIGSQSMKRRKEPKDRIWVKVLEKVFSPFIDFVMFRSQYVLFFIHAVCLIGICCLNLTDSLYMIPSLCTNIVLAIFVSSMDWDETKKKKMGNAIRRILLFFLISYIVFYMLYQVPRWIAQIFFDDNYSQNRWTYILSYLVYYIPLFILSYYEAFDKKEKIQLIISHFTILLVYIAIWLVLCISIPLGSLIFSGF